MNSATLLLRSASSAFYRVQYRHIQDSSKKAEIAAKQILNLPSPFEKERAKCLLCQHKIQVDYKNPRLLSQFVSPLTGEIYDKHITGLCEMQQILVQREIRKSRTAKFMPHLYKNPKYMKDPPLFNPSRPQRPNPH